MLIKKIRPFASFPIVITCVLFSSFGLGDYSFSEDSNHSNHSRCELMFKTILTESLEKTEDKLNKQFTISRRESLDQLLISTGDAIRRRLQVWNGHPYPIISFDDGTAIQAYALAKNAFEPLDTTTSTLLNDALTKFQDTLNFVKNYPNTLKNFREETKTWAAKAVKYNEILSENRFVEGYFDIPIIREDRNGKNIIEFTQQWIGSKPELQLLAKDANEELKKRIGKNFLYGSWINQLGFDQIVKIKQLETLRNFLLRQQSLHPGKNLPENLQNLLNNINELYTQEKFRNFALKPEYQPPEWARQKLHYIQLGAETNFFIKSFWTKYLPKVKDQEMLKGFLNFVKQVPENERRAWGIPANMSEVIPLLGRTKWVKFISSVAGGGAAALAQPTYDLFISDSAQKEFCAQSGESDYVECVFKYLELKFPKKFTLSYLNLKSILNGNGKMDDPEILKETQDIANRRKSLISQNNLRTNIHDAVTKEIQLEAFTPEQIKTKAINSKNNESFIAYLIGGQLDGKDVPGYLRLTYPLYFSNPTQSTVTDIIKTVLAEHDPDKRSSILQRLYAINSNLAEDFQKTLAKHSEFLAHPNNGNSNQLLNNFPGFDTNSDVSPFNSTGIQHTNEATENTQDSKKLRAISWWEWYHNLIK